MSKKLFFSFLFFLTVIFLSAQTFTLSGIKYKAIGANAVEVAAGQAYSGALILPSTVSNNGTSYSVTYIASSAFTNSTVTSINIPNTVTEIADGAFQNCSTLTSVVLPNALTFLGASAFNGCSSLTSVNIPSSLTTLQNGVFGNCTSLVSIQIPNSITSIGNSAFAGCTSLLTVVIPNGVTIIGSSAFSGCSSLTTVTIPATVNSIGPSSFGSCTALTTVICNMVTPLPIATSVFNNVNQGACTLIVPNGSVAAYQAAAIWTNFNPIVGTSLGTQDLSAQNNVQLYPNPIRNEVFLDVKTANSAELVVADLTGKVVFKKALQKSKNRIDTSALPKGVYIFNVNSAKKASSIKVIKN